MGVRHVHRRGLVANIDDADAKLRGMIPDRLDVAALQAENAVDSARLQETRDPSGAGIVVGIEVLALVAISSSLNVRVSHGDGRLSA